MSMDTAKDFVRHLDLFSGIGGFALACQMAGGIETIGFSEIEPYACSILKKHWPAVPNYGDIRNIRGVRADLVTGGFPCQPFSHAGKRRGAEDDRHLWPEMRRVISDARPAWVLGGNVAGIIGMELDKVLVDLEGLGYAAWPIVIPACALDASHRRDRVWILAADTHLKPSSKQKCEYQRAENNRGSCENELDAWENVAAADRLDGWAGAERKNGAQAGNGGEPVSHAESQQDGGIQQHPIPAHARASRDGAAAPAAWATEPGVGRVADGIPNRPHRLKSLGNAIVPQVAAEIIRTMMRVAQMSNDQELSHAAPATNS